MVHIYLRSRRLFSLTWCNTADLRWNSDSDNFAWIVRCMRFCLRLLERRYAKSLCASATSFSACCIYIYEHIYMYIYYGYWTYVKSMCTSATFFSTCCIYIYVYTSMYIYCGFWKGRILNLCVPLLPPFLPVVYEYMYIYICTYIAALEGRAIHPYVVATVSKID